MVGLKIAGCLRRTLPVQGLRGLRTRDILGACVELEYSDLRPLGFYPHLSAVCLQGHFPCGWDGLYPSGHLLIY